MTQRSLGSFLIRLEAGDDGQRTGIVTSVQTGEHLSFTGLSELPQILERWAGAGGAPRGTEEAEP